MRKFPYTPISPIYAPGPFISVSAGDLLVGQDHVDGRSVQVAVGEVVATVEGEEDVLTVVDVLDDVGGA